MSDRNEAYKHMDEHFNFWARNRHGNSNGMPFDMPGVGSQPHNTLTEWEKRLWLASRNYNGVPNADRSPSKLSDGQDENSDPRLTHSHRGFSRSRDDSNESPRYLQKKYDTDHVQDGFNGHLFQKEQKSRLVDRFDKAEPNDKAPRRRIPFISKVIATANSSTVLSTKSANEKRSARQKMKRRGRCAKDDTTLPSVQSGSVQGGNASDRRSDEEDDDAPVRTPTILRLTGNEGDQRRQVTEALLENRIDPNREADLLVLIKAFSADGNRNTDGDGEQRSEHAHEVSLVYIIYTIRRFLTQAGNQC